MFCCISAENNHWQSQWKTNLILLINHIHLRDRVDFLCYRGSRVQSKEVEKVRTETPKQGIEEGEKSSGEEAVKLINQVRYLSQLQAA